MAVALLARGIPPYQSEWIGLVSLLVFNFPLLLTDDRTCSSTPRTIKQSFILECFEATNGTICNKMWNMFQDAVIGRPYNNILPRYFFNV